MRRPTARVLGWCGVALLWVSECVLGVTVAAPGGTALRVAPDNAGIPYVRGVVGVPTGTVTVAWNAEPDVVSLDVPRGRAWCGAGDALDVP